LQLGLRRDESLRRLGLLPGEIRLGTASESDGVLGSNQIGVLQVLDFALVHFDFRLATSLPKFAHAVNNVLGR
jgi:hypothetical protein